MALKNNKTGRYLKVIRELTTFTPLSVQVFYYEFESEKDRIEYFKRESAIKKFLAEGDVKQALLQEEIKDAISKLGDTEKYKSVGDLPKAIRDLIAENEQFVSDLDTIRFCWNRSPLSKFKSQSMLDEIGFDKNWFTPLKSWGINSVHTGAFINQTFSYECLYKELKKVFKDDFIDC